MAVTKLVDPLGRIGQYRDGGTKYHPKRIGELETRAR